MGERTFSVAADITEAETLPGWVYAAHDVYERCRGRVFPASWQFVGDTDMVRAPGDCHPFMLLEGCLDEPLVLTRDEQDRLHCLSNVCTHRGNLVVTSPGRCNGLRCGYHGRRFGLDGSFRSMPEFEGVKGFPSERDNLPRAAMGSWGKWLFAGIAPGMEFDEWIGPVRRRLGWLPVHEFRLEGRLSRDYLVRANWALYCENYLEGFHIPFVHQSLAQTLEYGEYATELERWGTLQLGIAKGGEEHFELPRSSPDFGREVAAYYYWLWPNCMLNFYPWGLSVNVVRPLGVELTKVSFITYVWREERLGRGAGADLDRVEREDEAVVECVQRGVASRMYGRGRYSPTRETGVHHFHRLLAAAVGG